MDSKGKLKNHINLNEVKVLDEKIPKLLFIINNLIIFNFEMLLNH